MLGTLIETRGSRPRRLGGTLVSIALHTGIIGLVVAITARGTPRPRPAAPPATPVVYVVPAPVAPAPAPRPAPSSPVSAVQASTPVVIPPIRIPNALPPIDVHAIVTDPNWYDTRSSSPPTHLAGNGGMSSGPEHGAWDASAVDRAVVPSRGNPRPRYPEMMRAAHLEGHVDVRFIVDTAGRAEPGSIQVIAATHASFADAVRDVLLRSRYQPAEAHGERVRQVVEQRFEFALRR